MKIYNSATHQKEDFHPIERRPGPHVRVRPTVYDNIHIGNAAFISFGVIHHRWLIASAGHVARASPTWMTGSSAAPGERGHGRKCGEFSEPIAWRHARRQRARPRCFTYTQGDPGAMIGMIGQRSGGHAYAADNGDV